MLFTTHNITRFLLLFSFLSLAATAIELESCTDATETIQNANASGIFHIPGLSTGRDGLTVSDDSSLAWNITHAVYRDPSSLVTKGATYVSVPDDQLPGSIMEGLRYTTCLYRSAFPKEGTEKFPTEDGACASAATADCRRDLVEFLRQRAVGFHKESRETNSSFFDCLAFWPTPGEIDYPASCSNYTELVLEQLPRYEGLILSDGKGNSSCPAAIFDFFWDIQRSDTIFNRPEAEKAAPDKADNYTAYNEAVRSISNLLIVRFGNATVSDSLVDVQMLCPRVLTVSEGSESPTGETPTGEAPANLASPNNVGPTLLLSIVFMAFVLVW